MTFVGRNLGLSVVAEGVERADTIDYLSSAGCQVGQGYFWSRPMPTADLADWLAADPWSVSSELMVTPRA